MSTDLERLTQAERMLSEIANAQDAMNLMDLAEVARVYALKAKLGTASVNHATVIKMRAERGLAEVVDEGQRTGEIATPGQPKKTESIVRPANNTSPKSLEEIGITNPRIIHEARKIRDAYTDADLEEMEEDANAADRILSRAKLVREARPAPKPQMTIDPWSAEENDLRSRLEAGETVVISMRAGVHPHLYQWAERKGLFVRIDRRTDWGNPFELPADGDRKTVIANYDQHYLPYKPSLLNRLSELRGKALGCWCAPDACHGDVLKEWAER